MDNYKIRNYIIFLIQTKYLIKLQLKGNFLHNNEINIKQNLKTFNFKHHTS